MPDREPQTDPPSTRQRGRTARDPYVGTVFDDRYAITERIGAGGMGVVYKARQQGLERDVVVKVLTHDRTAHEVSHARFEREAKSLSRLDHPNVVSVYDFGYEGDLPYLVMEYVDGVQLGRVIRANGGLQVHEFSPIAAQILGAVGEAHRVELIHRDLKPGNIMLTEKRGNPNYVKVLDFGLAKLVNDDSDLTAQDNLVGSLPYLAPEQITDDAVSQRVDVYALGIVFYFMLAGRKPFEGANAKVLFDQVQTEPPPLRGHLADDQLVPSGLIDLVETCLHKDPEARPRDAGVLAEHMESLELEGGGSGAPRDGETLRVEAITDDDAPAGHDEVSSSEMVGGGPDTRDGARQRSQGSRRSKAPTGRRADGVDARKADTESGEAPSDAGMDGGDRRGAAPVLLAAALAGLAAAVGLAWWTLSAGTGASTEVIDSASAKSTNESDDSSGISRRLDAVEAFLEKGAIQRAEARLDMLTPHLPEQGAHHRRARSLRSRIRAARLVDVGAEHASELDYAAAEEAYREALQEVPEHTAASERLAALESLAEGTVELSEDTELKGFQVDGRRWSKAPYELRLEAGTHEVRAVRKDGRQWTDTISVQAEGDFKIRPQFESRPNEPTAARDEKRPAASERRRDENDPPSSPDPAREAAAASPSEDKPSENAESAEDEPPNRDDASPKPVPAEPSDSQNSGPALLPTGNAPSDGPNRDAKDSSPEATEPSDDVELLPVD